MRDLGIRYNKSDHPDMDCFSAPGDVNQKLVNRHVVEVGLPDELYCPVFSMFVQCQAKKFFVQSK